MCTDKHALETAARTLWDGATNMRDLALAQALDHTCTRDLIDDRLSPEADDAALQFWSDAILKRYRARK